MVLEILHVWLCFHNTNPSVNRTIWQSEPNHKVPCTASNSINKYTYICCPNCADMIWNTSELQHVCDHNLSTGDWPKANFYFPMKTKRKIAYRFWTKQNWKHQWLILVTAWLEPSFAQPSIPGYWRQKADERLDNPFQRNQEPLAVTDKVGGPHVSFGWASPWNMILFPSVLRHRWLGDRKGNLIKVSIIGHGVRARDADHRAGMIVIAETSPLAVRTGSAASTARRNTGRPDRLATASFQLHHATVMHLLLFDVPSHHHATADDGLSQ